MTFQLFCGGEISWGGCKTVQLCSGRLSGAWDPAGLPVSGSGLFAGRSIKMGSSPRCRSCADCRPQRDVLAVNIYSEMPETRRRILNFKKLPARRLACLSCQEIWTFPNLFLFRFLLALPPLEATESNTNCFIACIHKWNARSQGKRYIVTAIDSIKTSYDLWLHNNWFYNTR